jgi:hypothetical protein
MTNKFETVDPKGRKVTCTEDQWNNHILTNHSDMAGQEKNVQKAIEDPSMGIFSDAKHANRNIYYRKPPKKNYYIKVVVEFDGDHGFVITAFPADSGKQGEKLL